jgi:uncharacterized protein (UPF0216 family)
MEKWMKLEMAKIHSGLVTRKETLKNLLEMVRPVCKTREGGEYLFDKEVLEKVADNLPFYRHEELRLPINLHRDMKSDNQCYISDEIAAWVLRKMEGYEDAYRYRDGKMWLPESVAMDIVKRYPTIFQMVVFPG